MVSSTDYSSPNEKLLQHSVLPTDDDLLANVFITVKTTGRNHLTRLPVIIKTWFQLAQKQVLLCIFVYKFLFLLHLTLTACLNGCLNIVDLYLLKLLFRTCVMKIMLGTEQYWRILLLLHKLYIGT